MTLLLLDTNAYLRIAKRVKPLLGIAFGQKGYRLTILEDVEREFERSPRLQSTFPWFQDGTVRAVSCQWRLACLRLESHPASLINAGTVSTAV